MKHQNNLSIFKSIFTLMALVVISVFISCSEQAPKSKSTEAEVQDSSLLIGPIKLMDTLQLKAIASDIISRTKAQQFITVYNQANPELISVYWYFDKGHINELLNEQGVTIDGIRFFSAVNDQSSGKKRLTFIGTSVKGDGSNDNLIGGKLFEFARTCPANCKKNTTGNVNMNSTKITIPRAYYFTRAQIESAINDPEVTHLRLGRNLVSGNTLLDISICGVKSSMEGAEHEEVSAVYTEIATTTPKGQATDDVDFELN
ncbi:MAG: hypothetical protein FGM41_00530 [Bacteroidetes bacterium]|nr:hypothetical protein [Bacteroidota bacterium]